MKFNENSTVFYKGRKGQVVNYDCLGNYILFRKDKFIKVPEKDISSQKMNIADKIEAAIVYIWTSQYVEAFFLRLVLGLGLFFITLLILGICTK